MRVKPGEFFHIPQVSPLALGPFNPFGVEGKP